jgi:para-aminobenzoate synthetase/4-amino-4-deoxychorismate lyase
MHEDSSAPPWHPLPAIFRTLAAENDVAILLETAKQDGNVDKSLLFLHPRKELIARTPEELEELLRQIDRLVADGAFLAGYFTYECGEHFIGLPSRRFGPNPSPEPLAWFGVFKQPIEFDHRSGTVCGELPTPKTTAQGSQNAAIVRTEGLRIARHDYNAAIARIHHYLQAGDTYQVNFTDRIEGQTGSDPLTVYETLLKQQPVPFAVYLNRPAGPILSFSPELFYRTAQGRIVVRPMKGTWPRGMNLAEDRNAEARLRNDEKNRSEHVMIVDLLRNDLGRICAYGSVQVDDLFQVERYNTLLQMTSTCSGQLRDGLSPTQVLRNLFPSGSITGAPKRRTMEIIGELEKHPRGIYTGCIGYFAPKGVACFNVAIRTVTLRGTHLTMGVGGGITLDSKADEEFAECQLKAQFLTRQQSPFSLIETMRSVNGKIPLLPRHLQRLSGSAEYFGILYNEDALAKELASVALNRGSDESRVRLELNQNGEWSIATSPLEPVVWGGRLLLADERTCATDIFLHHKTTRRDLYERNLALAHRLGFDEVLFLNDRDALTEGAIGNIFLQTGERWVTPTLQSGVLPGVQRAATLEQLHAVEERELRLEDLAIVDSMYHCNALRGIRAAVSIETRDGTVLWSKTERP